MRIAVIDVGFNSLKMVKYRVDPDGSLRSYGQLGAMVRLGEGLERAGRLGSRPAARTIEAIKLCCEAASLESIKHILLIGTSPVREATNRDDFLAQVEGTTGLRMRVLTANEEALYGFLGAAKAVPGGALLFFDLGGGSLQVVYGRGSRILRTLCLPLGALKLTEQYSDDEGRFSRKGLARMRERISDLLPAKHELALPGDTVLVGTGGTVRAMARFHQQAVGYPFNKIHNYSLRSDSVREMSREFLEKDVDELAAIDAIGVDRAPTVAAGSVVVRNLMDQLGFERVLVSTHGLRDGILTEYLASDARSAMGCTRREEVERLLRRPDSLPQPSAGVELIESLVRHGVLDDRKGSLLLVAVRKGQFRAYADADADSLFWALMSCDLPISHEDQLLMAFAMVRARRPRTANWLMRRYGSMLHASDLKSVKKMGACLRLTEVLGLSDVQMRIGYSRGLRIAVVGEHRDFPYRLAKSASLALSAATGKPVALVASGAAWRRTPKILKARSS